MKIFVPGRVCLFGEHSDIGLREYYLETLKSFATREIVVNPSALMDGFWCLTAPAFDNADIR